MIKVLFRPGCYGTFLTKCLYKLTDLNEYRDRDFSFDAHGSSHDYRQIVSKEKSIVCGHDETLNIEETDKVIVILPLIEHQLDYFDNQFRKQEKEHLCKYIHLLYPNDEIEKKLSQNWNYPHQLDNHTPQWILREWCSFWIKDCLSRSYDALRYEKFTNANKINTQNIFENLADVIFLLAEKLNLKVLVGVDEMNSIQKKFVDAQQLHNIQKKCVAWVDDVIENRNSTSPCLTIFDQSYVQHLLREKGYEIRCNELNAFPSSAEELRALIYHV
jgi:hypothetical protein